MSGYIGAIPTPQATQSRDVYTATSNQTTFTTQGYTPNFVSVYLNGVHLARADFTATNGSDVVLASGATADDVVEIISFGTFQSADALPLTGGTMTGDLIVPDGDLILGSTAVTATAAEINLIDGGTARGTTALADGDGVLVNDAGTMRMTNVQTVKTYMTEGVGGLEEYIATSGAISNAATVSFTGFDSSKYVRYRFVFDHVLSSADPDSIRARTSSNGGSSYDSGSTDYHAFGGTTDATSVDIISGNTQGFATNEHGISIIVECYQPHNTSVPTSVFTNGGVWVNTTHLAFYSGLYATYGGIRVAEANVNAIQFFFNSGNIASGNIKMYGIKDGT